MEAADSTANSSKVIVQCHDPQNLFEAIVPRLEPRLPLSKLHWKSPNRPLRSIDQLNVSFVRDDPKSDATTSARRHQIPGLRQTPFVKIFLVRCDERETYKETCRKDIKAWLKSQGISQDGKTLMKGQERHDAYEYIILHVVFPGTAAAAQPKSSKHISLEASESTDSVNSKSKWTGKSQSTIFDKLRADFSSSSKAPFERVAQVRITDLNSKQSLGIGQSEVEEQWQDFIEKLKTAILLSFDARVAQYEEDIRDREAQRQLPGWNFCTFFVLKEGLARGFENVGLIEDALTVYNELDAGLDVVVQEHASKKEPDPTGELLPFSNDLKPTIRLALDELEQPFNEDLRIPSTIDLASVIDLEKADFPFDVEKRNYQHRILTNQVSALDFHIYIFTRQFQLLSRLARLSQPTTKSEIPTSKAQQDLNVVAEICEKATGFITYGARALRRDLYSAWGGQDGLSDEELETQRILIGGIVASWKWSAITQILADCQITRFLGEVLIDESRNFTRGETIGQSATTNGHATIVNESLAVWSGELFVMARDILRDSVMSEDEQSETLSSTRGLRSVSLGLISRSRPVANDSLKSLTIYAYQCFHAADRTNASHSMLHALARIAHSNGHINEAVWWLEHVPDLSNLFARTATDRTLLRFYAECLQAQGRLDEYARTLFGLLLCTVSNPFARAVPRYDEHTQQVLNEIIAVSNDIAEIQLPLDGFFVIHDVAKTISFGHQVDGFELSLDLSLRFNASVELTDFELTLNAAHGHDPAKLVLKSRDIVTLNGARLTINLASNTVTHGWYTLDRLTIKVGRAAFVHDFQSMTVVEEDVDRPSTLMKSPPIMIYPHSKTFSVAVQATSSVDLTKPSRLSFEINSSVTSLEEVVLRLQPATAGVRLNIQAATFGHADHADNVTISNRGEYNVIVLQKLARPSRTVIEIPYTTEILTTSIMIKIEAICTTSDSSFSTFYRRSVNVNLPVSINVQDIFQVGRMFSRFTASPSTIAPLRLLKWMVADNEDFEVDHDDRLPGSIDVFPKMPASWIIEAIPKRPGEHKLPLVLEYQSYEELILRISESQFRRDVESTASSFATELLVSHLVSQLPTIWNEQDLEAAALLQEFEMPSYEAMSWNDTLRALKPMNRNLTEQWLRLWHADHQTVDLRLADAPIRKVKLSVAMPQPSLVISTHLSLNLSGRQFIAIGEAVSACLTIKLLCQSDVSTEIQFEITSQPDTWLIGGKKRGILGTQPNINTFNVLLIAQRSGHILLPSIDVRVHRPNNRNNQSNTNIEVESRSQAKSILVIPDMQTTTIAIGSNELAGRHWPINNQRRLGAT